MRKMMMAAGLLALCALVPLAGARADEAVSVSLQVDALVGPGQRRLLAPGETLRSGDRIALTVAVDRAAYLCVAHARTGEPATLLFPRAGDKIAAAQPGAPLFVPARGESLKLDDQIGARGTEDLFVVATTRPPADADAQRRDCLRRLADAPPPPKDSDKPPPPGPVDGNERNPPPRFDARSRTLVARAGKDGSAALRFPYKHARAAAR